MNGITMLLTNAVAIGLGAVFSAIEFSKKITSHQKLPFPDYSAVFSPIAFGQNATIIASIDGTGALTATVLIEVSHDNVHWATLTTLSLSGTTTASQIYSSQMAWPLYRANVTAITGIGATVNASIAS